MYIPILGTVTIILATIGLLGGCGLMIYYIIETIRDIKRICK